MDERLSGLISSVYDSALDPSLYPEIGRGLALIGGGCSAFLTWQSPGGVAETMSYNGIDADTMRLYDESHHPANPGIDFARAYPTGTVVDASPCEIERTPFYADFMRPRGYGEIVHAAGALIETPTLTAAVSVQRTRGQGGFAETELAALQLVVPHLTRLMALRARLGDSERHCLEAQDALDALSLPVMRVSGDGRLLYANAQGERLLCSKAGLACRSGRLTAATAGETAALRAVIERACGGEGASVRLSREARLRPLSVIVIPVVPRLTRRLCEALVFVSDPERRPTSLAARLTELYGLSRAEAEVALALADGEELDAIREVRGVKASTLRTQISSVLAKTDTRRQAELAALIARLYPLT